ncbi:MAG: hypothetical protein PHE43_00135 [Candidatus Nanoarchaeia archaeon]|nr:hypothetical protein [Candidatus Nanoarchaeia archaeon]
MASLIDFGFFSFLKPVFTWILVFVILYAIIAKTKIFGSAAMGFFAAFAISFLFMVTPGVSDLITVAAPWYAILMILIVLILLVFMFVGIGEDKISVAFEQPWLIWLIVIIVIVGIFGYAATKTFGGDVQGLTSDEEGSDVTTDIAKILFHPRLLGALFILVVAAQAIRLIGGKK